MTTTRKTASIGTPKSELAATSRYCLLMPVIGLPLEVSSARPRTAVMVPSVMMNGGRSPIATPTPFTRPTARPANIATTSGTISGYCP